MNIKNAVGLRYSFQFPEDATKYWGSFTNFNQDLVNYFKAKKYSVVDIPIQTPDRINSKIIFFQKGETFMDVATKHIGKG